MRLLSPVKEYDPSSPGMHLQFSLVMCSLSYLEVCSLFALEFFFKLCLCTTMCLLSLQKSVYSSLLSVIRSLTSLVRPWPSIQLCVNCLLPAVFYVFPDFRLCPFWWCLHCLLWWGLYCGPPPCSSLQSYDAFTVLLVDVFNALAGVVRHVIGFCCEDKVTCLSSLTHARIHTYTHTHTQSIFSRLLQKKTREFFKLCNSTSTSSLSLLLCQGVGIALVTLWFPGRLESPPLHHHRLLAHVSVLLYLWGRSLTRP